MGRKILLGTAALMIAAVVCWANGNGNLSEENAQLRRRVEKLEKEVEQLKKMVMQQTEPAKAVKEETKSVPPPKLDEIDLQKIAAKIQKETEKKKPAWSDLDVQLYGIFRLDSSYDTAQVEPGNYIKWVKPKSNHRDDQFDMTANQSRVGLRINGPDDNQTKASGLFEVDFYGGGEENKATLRMRHGYMKLEWPDARFDIIAGQTCDVISPLNPYTLNDTVAWFTGNIGYRRPQLRLTKSFALNSDTDLKLEGALARTIGRKASFTGAIDSGEDAGFPCMQARTSITFPWFGPKPTTVGLSGHFAGEEYDISSPGGAHRDFRSWSANLDLTQPINKWLVVKSEMFTGENLDAYAGGIGQGVRNTGTTSSPDYNREIGSKGGWIGGELGPWDRWRFNICAGVDDVDGNDVRRGDRTLNRSALGNVVYSINKNAEVGFELSHWRTDYKGTGDADSLRAQMSLMYKF